MAYVDQLLPAALLETFDRELATTRKILLRVPTERFTWHPHPRCLTLGALANHLMNMPLWLNFILGGSSWDLAEGGTADREVAESTAELVALFDHNVREARVALAGADERQLREMWSLRRQDDVLFSMPRFEAIRQVFFNHQSLHRDQLASYLRTLESERRHPDALMEFPESAVALAASGQIN